MEFPLTRSAKAIVATAPGEFGLQTITIPNPGPGEVVVAIESCGVCRADLHFLDGDLGNDYPYLLGHEAAGTIEAIGPDVTNVEVGDYVLLNWRAVCNECRNCRRGRQHLCTATKNADQPMTWNNKTLTPALGVGAFAERTLVAAGQATKVDPVTKTDPALALLSCSAMAGIGAVLHAASVKPGDSVVVIGCGGVGNAAILGALLAGATTIIAADRNQQKLEWAANNGATHTIDTSDRALSEAVHEITGDIGVDAAFDTVGNDKTYLEAFRSLDIAGTLVLLGTPPAGNDVTISMRALLGRGCTFKTSWYGDCIPERDFPALARLYEQGKIDLDSLVTETISIEEVGSAIEKLRTGATLRSILVPEPK